MVEKTVWTLDQPISDTETGGSWNATEAYTYPWACSEQHPGESDVGTGTDSGTGTYQIVNHGSSAELILEHTSQQYLPVTWPCGYSFSDVPDAPGDPYLGFDMVPGVNLAFAADGSLSGKTEVYNDPSGPATGLPGVTQVINYSINGIQPFTTTTSTTPVSTMPITTATPTTPVSTTPASANSPAPGLIRRVCGSGITTIVTTETAGGAGLAGAITETAGWGLSGAAIASVGLGCSVVAPRRNSPAWAEAACSGLGTLSIQTGVASLFGDAFGVVPGLLLGGASLLTGAASLFACAGDPVDQSYRMIARPRLVAVHLSFGKLVSHARATLLTAAAQNAFDVSELGRAMMLCIDRASGAHRAHARVWEKRQSECAAAYAHRLAGLIRAQLQLRRAILQALITAGVPDRSVNPTTLIGTFQHASPETKLELRTAGLTSDEILFVQQVLPRLRLSENSSLGVYGVIDGPATVRLTKQAANGFEAIARKYS